MLHMLVAFIAQVDPASLPAELSFGDALQGAIGLIGTAKGASALAIAGIVVQVAMLAMRTKLAEFTGLWRWFIYSGLSLVAMVLAAKIAGAPWVSALLNAPVMTALGNWLHQLPVQVSKAKTEKEQT